MIKKDQGEVAVLFSMDENGKVEIDKYCLPQKKKQFTQDGLRNTYLAASLDATTHDKLAHHQLSSFVNSIYSVKDPCTTNLYEVEHVQDLKFAKLFDINRTKCPLGIPKTYENQKHCIALKTQKHQKRISFQK